MQRDLPSAGDEPSADVLASSGAANVEVEILVDSEIVEAYQSKWPDWREKMAAVIRAAAKEL